MTMEVNSAPAFAEQDTANMKTWLINFTYCILSLYPSMHMHGAHSTLLFFQTKTVHLIRKLKCFVSKVTRFSNVGYDTLWLKGNYEVHTMLLETHLRISPFRDIL